jgi:hypothetical protein
MKNANKHEAGTKHYMEPGGLKGEKRESKKK